MAAIVSCSWKMVVQNRQRGQWERSKKQAKGGKRNERKGLDYFPQLMYAEPAEGEKKDDCMTLR
eukprot:580546-Pelagomonas_calceolata.AAC.1